MRYRLPVMSLSWKRSLRPRSLLEAMPKYSLKSRPRSWCSFFRQLLTTGIYPSVVLWSWPVIKPASPASLFKWHISPIYGCGRCAHQPRVHGTVRYTTVESTRWRNGTVTVSFILPQEILFLKWKWRRCELGQALSQQAYLKSLVLIQRARVTDLWSALSLYLVLELYPQS